MAKALLANIDKKVGHFGAKFQAEGGISHLTLYQQRFVCCSIKVCTITTTTTTTTILLLLGYYYYLI